MSFKINHHERALLQGLPHLQRLIYVFALRPYMDYQTGIVGIKRGVSHQSIAEELYVEPHPGYRSGSPSKDQIRRGLKSLEKAGVIALRSTKKRLIAHCLLADKNCCDENKAATKTPPKSAKPSISKPTRKSASYKNTLNEAAIAQREEGAIPQVSGNINTLSQKKLTATVIDESFQPSTKVISKAKQHNCPTANCQDELIKFIAFHQSKGTKRQDWNAEFLGWLLRAKQYQQERQYASKTKPTKRRIPKNKNLSAVDRVFSANQSLINDNHQLNRGQIIEHYE